MRNSSFPSKVVEWFSTIITSVTTILSDQILLFEDPGQICFIPELFNISGMNFQILPNIIVYRLLNFHNEPSLFGVFYKFYIWLKCLLAIRFFYFNKYGQKFEEEILSYIEYRLIDIKEVA